MGLLPNDLLELNLGQVQAVIDGYSDRVLDHTCIAVWSGYYSAYYSGSKHAKKPSEIIAKMQNMNTKRTDMSSSDQNINSEIERFAERDLHFAFVKMGGDSSAD